MLFIHHKAWVNIIYKDAERAAVSFSKYIISKFSSLELILSLSLALLLTETAAAVLSVVVVERVVSRLSVLFSSSSGKAVCVSSSAQNTVCCVVSGVEIRRYVCSSSSCTKKERANKHVIIKGWKTQTQKETEREEREKNSEFN